MNATDPITAAHFSMTDEEGDLPAFQAYLRALPPESLWDVLAHVDADRYPRREEATRREIERRRLFFVSPYTREEQRLRCVAGIAVGLALLAAALHAIPVSAAWMGNASHDLGAQAADPWGGGGSGSVGLGLSSREQALLFGLLRGMRPFVFVSSALLLAATLHILLTSRLHHPPRRRVRTEVLATLLIACALTGLLVRFAFY